MTKVGVEGFYMILKLVVTDHLSSQFFNYISDVEKQVQLHGSSCCEGDNWQIMKDNYILEL